jgi:hypothetical protein
MWIIQEPNNVALWNNRHFEERKTEIMQHVFNIQYGYLLKKYLKCSVWRLAARYDIYVWHSAAKGFGTNSLKHTVVAIAFSKRVTYRNCYEQFVLHLSGVASSIVRTYYYVCMYVFITWFAIGIAMRSDGKFIYFIRYSPDVRNK